MIKRIISISCRPIQIIFDGIRHRRYQRKMMSYTLKINNANLHTAVKG